MVAGEMAHHATSTCLHSSSTILYQTLPIQCAYLSFLLIKQCQAALRGRRDYKALSTSHDPHVLWLHEVVRFAAEGVYVLAYAILAMPVALLRIAVPDGVR